MQAEIGGSGLSRRLTLVEPGSEEPHRLMARDKSGKKASPANRERASMKRRREETTPTDSSEHAATSAVARLPATRSDLLALHAELRHRRNSLQLDSAAFRDAAIE